MEPREYETLEALEDRFWWYRGLHRLVLERCRDLDWSCAPKLRRESQPDVESQRDPEPGRDAEPHGGTEPHGGIEPHDGIEPQPDFDSRPDLTERPHLEILDAGCGTGGMLRKLRTTFPDARLTGIDWSPHAVVRARRTEAGRRMARASVSDLPFPDCRFDLLVSLDVLYHAGVPDDVEALREFERVLRPGGYVVLNLPAFESLRSSHDRAIHTARRYRKDELASRLVRAGLEPVRVHYWNGFLFPALAAVRWIRRGQAQKDQPVAPSDVRPLPNLANRALELALSIERAWLRHAPLPFGLSVLAVARRTSRTDTNGAPDPVSRRTAGVAK